MLLSGILKTFKTKYSCMNIVKMQPRIKVKNGQIDPKIYIERWYKEGIIDHNFTKSKGDYFIFLFKTRKKSS